MAGEIATRGVRKYATAFSEARSIHVRPLVDPETDRPAADSAGRGQATVRAVEQIPVKEGEAVNIIKSDDPNVLGEATFDGHAIRITGDIEHPWFVLADVCEAVGLEKPRSVAAKLSADEKGAHSVGSLGGNQQMTVVSESGLYAVILRCRDAMTEGTAAYRFRRWVTNEVLPSIRKTGRYDTAGEPNSALVDESKPVDMLPGDRFANLVVVREAEQGRFRHRRVVVKCDCGMEFTVRATLVRIGSATRCMACSRRQDRLPAPPKTDAFLLETYQLAFASAARFDEASAVMSWCHKQMLERASR